MTWRWRSDVLSYAVCFAGGGGLSGGWIFVIIVLVLAFVYCAIGKLHATTTAGSHDDRRGGACEPPPVRLCCVRAVSLRPIALAPSTY